MSMTDQSADAEKTSKFDLSQSLISVVEAQTKEVVPQTSAFKDIESVKALQKCCRQLCLASFFRDQSPIRSLGFTSSVAGEGKSFLSIVMAGVLAAESSSAVTLLECNWTHPCLHKRFGIIGKPGLAEWLRGECREREIRHSLGHNLSVIPAGDGQQDTVRLLRQVRQTGLLSIFNNPDEMFIVDLPPVITSAYGALAASLVESLVIVVRAGVTTNLMTTQTCEQLKHLPVQGIILNQVESRIPSWIREIL